MAKSTSLLQRVLKQSKIKESAILEKSKYFNEKDQSTTASLALNIALSGNISGGISAGLTQFAGPSKHFKTLFGLVCIKAFLDKYDDAIVLYYDTEFGSTPSYVKSAGVDPARIIHSPVKNIEELKFDIIQQLENISRKDKVFIFIDSIGNIASKKEIDDALGENQAADMTRAKQLKSLFRMMTPYLTMNDIPCVVVNHTYASMQMFSGPTVSGGCLAAGTKIKMANGITKNIEDILLGESVVTLQGVNEVTAVWNPKTLMIGEPKCFQIEFEDGHTIVCSDKHKFLVNNNWVEAENLSLGDSLGVLSDEYTSPDPNIVKL